MALKRGFSVKIKSTLNLTKDHFSLHKSGQSVSSNQSASSSSHTSVSRSRISSFSSSESHTTLDSFELDRNGGKSLPAPLDLTAPDADFLRRSSSTSHRRDRRGRHSGSILKSQASGRYGKAVLDTATASTTENLDLETDKKGENAEPNEVILLPIDPEDKVAPPCTPDQLTPIIPMTVEQLNNKFPTNVGSPVMTSDELFVSHDNISTADDGTVQQQRKRPLIISSLSSTSNTATFVSGSSSVLGNSLSQSTSSDSVKECETANSRAGLYATLDDEQYKDHIDPLFLKANQIDHFDKFLDKKKNDKLADQMGWNILHNISEGNVDELSMLNKDVPDKFACPMCPD